MRLLPIISSAALLTAFCFAACKKDTKPPAPITFTVKGQLLKDCSGMPVANEVLIASAITTAAQSFGSLVVGRDTTDSAGYFTMTCASYDEDRFYLKQSWAEEQKGAIRILPRQGEVIDLGTLYENYTATAILQFNFVQPHSDTLFVVGWYKADTSFIYPASGTRYLRVTRSGMGKPSQLYEAHFGFGRAMLDSLTKGNGGSMISAEQALEICGDGDTTVVNVPSP